MKKTERGLVLREVKLRESDRILTLLTAESGIISVSARGSMKPGSKLFSACGLFSYSEWTLHQGKTAIYSVTEASPIEVFFGLRQSLEAVSLAAYIAELLQIFSPQGDEAGRLLRLALNSLHVLSEGKRGPLLVKAVFELRSAAETGYMPELLACDECGRYEGGGFFFDTRQGTLLCGACARQAGQAPNLSAGALAALRHIVLSDEEEIYRFSLGEESLALLGRPAEEYLLYNLDHRPKSLDFLQSLLPGGAAAHPGAEKEPINDGE